MRPNQRPPEIPPEFFAILIGAIIVGFLIGLVIIVFYCLTMQKALNRCAEHNRLMAPGMVWLCLIPCFGFVWQFFIAIQIPGSLQKEFEDRRRSDGSDYGKTIGLVCFILYAVAIPISVIPIIGLCGSLLSLTGFVLFIIFWVKIATYSGQLGDGGSGGDIGRKLKRFDDRDDDDDDDDGGRRPSGNTSIRG